MLELWLKITLTQRLKHIQKQYMVPHTKSLPTPEGAGVINKYFSEKILLHLGL